MAIAEISGLVRNGSVRFSLAGAQFLVNYRLKPDDGPEIDDMEN